MIDSQGKIRGKVSIVDILIVVLILALAAGFIYRRASEPIAGILRTDETALVTFEVNRIRNIIAHDTIAEGDLFFRQHATHQALGRVVAIEHMPAMEIIRRADGTSLLATMEERYSLRITIEATGTIRGTGFFANGNDHLAPGAEVMLINSNIFLPTARVYSVEVVSRDNYHEAP